MYMQVKNSRQLQVNELDAILYFRQTVLTKSESWPDAVDCLVVVPVTAGEVVPFAGVVPESSESESGDKPL